jgi:hypothetical protein
VIHFTCDQCAKELDASDRRFVVRIECHAAAEPVALTEDDLDQDRLDELGDMLRDMETEVGEEETAPTRVSLRYDLCPECHSKFLRDPLGKDVMPKLHFSEN